MLKFRFHWVLFFVTQLFLVADGGCPDVEWDRPCICRNGVDGDISEVSCRGEMGLVKLTTLLRRDLCGQTIQQFKLINSDIQYLPSNLFFKVEVKDIQVSSTNISHFTQAGRSAFFGLEHVLASLSMRHCHLVDGLQWQKVGQLHALTYLDLSYNDLTGVPRQWFSNPPPNLLSLILKGNRISALESGSFAQMYSLIELDMSENRIATLQRDVFPHPGNALIFLRINENNLTFLPDDLFHEMMGLKRIYLDGNRIKSLSRTLWSLLWGDLEHLDLNGNPLQCDCDASWIAELRPPERLYASCWSSPNQNLTGLSLRQLEVDHFEFCDSF